MTDWESCYLENNMPWNKDAPSPPLEEWVRRMHPQARALVPGCGAGHDVAMLAEAGVDVIGLDIAPTAIRLAKTTYPTHANRFVFGDLFALPKEWLGAFDLVIEHTCLSGMPPELRPQYRDAVTAALKPGGLLVGIWYINPDMDPGETGPPFALPVEKLDALFPVDSWEIVEDTIPKTTFPGREGRERLRVLKLLTR